MADIGWNPAPTIALVAQRLRMRLARVGAAMEASCKELVSRSNTPVRGPHGGKARGRDPSLPGEPPKRVFGHLRASIAYEVVMVPGLLVLRFGVLRNGPASAYAAALEFGFHGARHVAGGARAIGPGFKVTGKKTLRFAPRAGPTRRVAVAAFVRAFNLEARPYIRPTFRSFAPRIPAMLAGSSA